MLKIFISLIVILFLINVEKSLANQEDIIEIEIPITKNEESKITNTNTFSTNKKSLGNNSNFQKTRNLLNINSKKTDYNSDQTKILGTIKKSINPEKNQQATQNSIIENKIINSKKKQSSIKSKKSTELTQRSLESKQILEPIADIEVIEDDKISNSISSFFKAAKSFSKTNELLYFAFSSPLARTLPGHK